MLILGYAALVTLGVVSAIVSAGIAQGTFRLPCGFCTAKG